MADETPKSNPSSRFGEDVPLEPGPPVRHVGASAAENRGGRPGAGSGAVIGSGAGAGGGGNEDPDTEIQAGSSDRPDDGAGTGQSPSQP